MFTSIIDAFDRFDLSLYVNLTLMTRFNVNDTLISFFTYDVHLTKKEEERQEVENG